MSRVFSNEPPISSASWRRRSVISSAVMDVGKRLSTVCTKRSSLRAMVPPITVRGPKYSSELLMPTPLPSVWLSSFWSNSRNARSSAPHRPFSSR